MSSKGRWHDWKIASYQGENSVRLYEAVASLRGGSKFFLKRDISLLSELEPGWPNERVNHLVLLAARRVQKQK